MKKLISQLSKVVCALVIITITSCKTLKVDANSKVTKNSSAKEVLAIHSLKEFKFTTLQSKVKANYDDGKKSVSPSITLRMEKNHKIWLSAKFLGFTVAKIFITPNRFSFYEKLNKRYYDGDLALLANFLGQEVNFKQIQSLFLGQNIINFNPKELESKVLDDKLVLSTSKKDYVIEVLFNILNDKVAAYQVQQGKKVLSVKYPTYQKVNNQDFPLFMHINSSNQSSNRSIEMNFKSVTVDENLSFPYSIPKGYSEFKFKN